MKHAIAIVFASILGGCVQAVPSLQYVPPHGVQAPQIARDTGGAGKWTYRGTFSQVDGRKTTTYSVTQLVSSESSTFKGKPAIEYRGQESAGSARASSLTYDATVIQQASSIREGVDVMRVNADVDTSSGVHDLVRSGDGNGTFDQLPHRMEARWVNAASREERTVDSRAGSSVSEVYNSDGSYDESGIPVAGRITTAQTYPNGNGIFQWPLGGAPTNSTLTVIPPKSAKITMYIADAAALPLPSTITVRIGDWYPSFPPPLASDTLVDEGDTTIPTDCGTGKRFGTTATELVERSARLDFIYGEYETLERTTWTKAPYGVVCAQVDDVMASYYDFATFKFSGRPLSVTTTREVLGLQAASGGGGEAIVAAPLEARLDAWRSAARVADSLAIYRSLRFVSSTGAPEAAAAARATFVVTVPTRSRAGDVSPSTKSLLVKLADRALLTMNVAVGSPNCVDRGGTRVCTESAMVPSGAQTFEVSAFDGPKDSGNTLAAGDVNAEVTQGRLNRVPIRLAGIPASLQLAIADAYPPAGAAATTNVSVLALDADGNTIIGKYDDAVSLSDSDGSGATSLSATSIPDSATKVTLAYDGALLLNAVIKAAALGVSPVSQPFAPTPHTAARYTPPPVVENGIPLPAGLSDLCIGPDGNVWVTAASTGAIMKFEGGKFTTYPALGSEPLGLTIGSDHALWFAESLNGRIGRITTAGKITTFKIPVGKGQTSQPAWVTLGADGRVWFTDQGTAAVGAVSPDGTVVTYPLPANALPNEIVTGPDKNLWITDDGLNAILVVSTAGKLVATHRVPTKNAIPWGIAVGPDKNLWFAEFGGNRVARMSIGGSVREWPTPSGFSGPLNVAAGPDGNMWFTESGGGFWNDVGKIAYITPDGRISEFASTPKLAHAHDLVFDSTGALWYTQFNSAYSALSRFAY